MDIPYLTEILFVISIMAFLIALYVILPSMVNKRWFKRFGRRKKKEMMIG